MKISQDLLLERIRIKSAVEIQCWPGYSKADCSASTPLHRYPEHLHPEPLAQVLLSLTLVPDKVNFPQEELRVLDYWKSIGAFQKQLKLTSSLPPYVFYDGPPFATGTPHYGNLLAGTVKDICTRYAVQSGRYVERRFGWDCHGLPVEHEMDKRLSLNSAQEHLDFGIAKYNAECRKIVALYAQQWKQVVERFGRWVDFDGAYRTMDLNYMESVWWVFKELYNKELIYRSSRVMPFSTACNTVLSNFEANSNYKETTDPSLLVTFPLIGRHKISAVAWTTTPWTLPCNLALSVNPEFDYVMFEHKGERYVCGKENVEEVRKLLGVAKNAELKVVETFSGKEMIGWKYEPLFPYYKDHKNAFRIIEGEFVSKRVGTGVVHTAPGFGEEDFNACCRAGIIKPESPPCPVNDSGQFTDPVVDYKGVYIKDADKLIKEQLKKKKRLLAASSVRHSYPFCWRSDTPLIYKAVQAWFFKVTALKDELLKNNLEARWVPHNIREKRFHNWLADAKDWCFSRNRYWGNPIPLWVSDDYQEIIPVGSVKELAELAGIERPADIHRDSIDGIGIPSRKGKGMLRRIPEVFDCWFESGAMPFAQCHYPFDTKDPEFSAKFPADFIAEGLDQTRGWFYTLLVLSTALKGTSSYKNLIVHGLILAKDGKKMSKHLHNYTDPTHLANKTGADAIRLYMINSPVVKAEGLKFSDNGVEGIVKEVLLPWHNAYRFLVQNITRWEMQTGKTFVFDESMKEKVTSEAANVMDRWIVAAMQNLIKFIRQEMGNYRLYTVVPKLLKFLDQLTNGYVRFNRSRIKGDTSLQDWNTSLNILFNVMLNTTIAMACYTPFTSEMIYQNLKNGITSTSLYSAESVHHLRLPQADEELIDEEIESRVGRMRNVVALGRAIRDKKKLPVKQPLQELVIICKDTAKVESIKALERYILGELNVFSIKYCSNEEDYVYYKVDPNYQAISDRLGKHVIKALRPFIENLTDSQIKEYTQHSSLTLKDNEGKEYKLQQGDIITTPIFFDKHVTDGKYGCACNLEGSVMLNVEVTEELNKARVARELTNHVQMARKDANVNIEDSIVVYYSVEGEELKSIVEENMGHIRKALKVPLVSIAYMPNILELIYKDQYTLPSSGRVSYILGRSHVVFDVEKIKEKLGNVRMAELNKALREIIEMAYDEVKEIAVKDELEIVVDGKKLKLKNGIDMFLNIEEYLKAKQN
eukprot:TRINITY_DN12873_c0_g1_i2.p1 TRINITY_DN12873_c0_g1~~TRINITY_DN12873_c0_g1_i2.p1  ORF type:complete len:1211 (-),score=322.55 TRINITY_DN12873_c0_g1_i2:192-3824(-)